MEEMKLVEADRPWGQVGERPGLGGTRGAQEPGPPRSLHLADTVKTCRLSTLQAKEGGGRGHGGNGEMVSARAHSKHCGSRAGQRQPFHQNITPPTPPTPTPRQAAPRLPGPRHVYHTARASPPCAGCKRVFPDFIESFTGGITPAPRTGRPYPRVSQRVHMWGACLAHSAPGQTWPAGGSDGGLLGTYLLDEQMKTRGIGLH